MYEQLSFLGSRLREQRRERRLTLRALAAKTGLSAGLLSKIENFRTIPSLPVLLSIAKALRLDPAELFSDLESTDDERPWRLIRAGEATSVERENCRGIDYRLLLESGLDASELQVMLVTVSPGARRRAVSGAGMELLHLLSGSLDYRVGGDTLQLSAGDTLFFDGSLPHVPQNHSDADAVMLVCYFLREEKRGRGSAGNSFFGGLPLE